MSFRPKNKRSILLLHSMKTAYGFIFERSELLVDLRQTLLNLKLNFAEVGAKKLTIPKTFKKWHNEETKEAAANEDMAECAAVFVFTNVNIILQSIYCKVVLYTKISKDKTLMDCMRTSTGESNFLRGSFAVRRVSLWRISQWDYGRSLVRIFFHKESGIA